MVAFDRRIFGDKLDFSFPRQDGRKKKLSDILDVRPDERYTLSKNLWAYLQGYAKKHQQKGNGFGFGLPNLDGISRTLSARYYKDGSEILIKQGRNKRPRRLTPRECQRLMGYPDDRPIVVSDTQAYKQFGNGVVVPVVKAVVEEILNAVDRSGVDLGDKGFVIKRKHQ